MSMLELRERPLDGGLTIHVGGEVDSSNAAQLRDRLRRAAAQGSVVVDLRSVPFMDSAGLGALICGIREMRIRGGKTALCVSKGGVQRLLSVTGFDQVVTVTRSMEEAQEAIAGAGAQREDGRSG